MPTADAIFEALDTIDCGVLVGDGGEGIALVNQRFASWMGYTRQEMVGMQITDLVPDEVREVLRAEIASHESGDERARLLVFRRKDGSTFPSIVIPSHLRHDGASDAGGITIIVELSTVQTAVPAGYEADDIRSQLSRIAFELQSMSLAVSLPSGEAIPLDHPSLSELSPREREILAHLVAGDRVPAIAAQLYISEHTVRNHLKSIYRKLEVGGQSELIQLVRGLRNAS